MTAVALGLRTAGFEQSLFGDEIYALEDVRGRSLGGVIDYVRSSIEVTPPLYFVLAWFSAKLGDPTIWIRLPSLVLGTATVPVVYAVGRELRGNATGLLAAVLVALSPHAIFYSTEARPYATAAFMVALSTLALLRALATDRGRWWILYALAGALAVYTHYTTVFPLVAQGGWALLAHREKARTIVVAGAGAFLLYLPWLPFVSGKQSLYAYRLIEFSADSVSKAVLHLLAGIPFGGLSRVPGDAALWLLGIGFGGALVVALLRQPRPSVRDPIWMVAAMALASFTGLLAYTLITDYNLFSPRNLTAALPALAVAVAALVTAARGRAALALGLVIACGLGIGAARTATDENAERPPYREAAELIERRAGPGDAILELTLGSFDQPLTNLLEAHFDPPRPIYPFWSPDQAWRRAATAPRSFVVVNHGSPDPFGPAPAWLRLVDHTIYRGFINVAVFEYVRRRSATG